MIVSESNLKSVVDLLSQTGSYGLDTETTGLRWGDRLFSIILSTENEDYYFNFQPYEILLDDQILDKYKHVCDLKPIFDNPDSTFFVHNAKFDMHMLAKEGLFIKGDVHCTQTIARLLKNNKLSYSLDACASEIGYKKDDTVEKLIAKKKLYTWINIPGKKTRDKDKHYYKVPPEIIIPYGERDGEIVRKLGVHQVEAILDVAPYLNNLCTNERELTKTCFEMERTGILIDEDYVLDARAAAIQEQKIKKEKFTHLSGVPFVDSFKALSLAFSAYPDEKFLKTEKGNPSFNKKSIERMLQLTKNNEAKELAQTVLEIRHAEKIIGTYYSSFLYYMDDDKIIHANIRQSGTDTGRFSYSNPNLQNIPKEEGDTDYPVRRSFVPRSGYCFTMIDYDQQEFRMMLDYAGEKELIQMINNGHDVHQATADLVGISRKHAKTLNFGLLYGMGVKKLAAQLNISYDSALLLKKLYFERLPKVAEFIDEVIQKGESRGFIRNWEGRRYHIDKRDYAYKLPNHLIQGGCSEVIKFAMVKLNKYLEKYKSRMLLQVHDELLFEVHESELDIVPKLKSIMESVYPSFNGMKLNCSIEHSWKSWADKEEGCPQNSYATYADLMR
jgi:DNA polymerase-1